MTDRYIVIDFESFYSQEYSLKKMTPPEYVLHPLFRSHGASIILGDSGVPTYLEHEQLVLFFERLTQRGIPVAMVSHNALFDMCVLYWRYGYLPKLMIDTMGMMRTLRGHLTPRVSLAETAKLLGIRQKGGFLSKTVGMSVEQIKAAGLWKGYVDYANDDAFTCRQAFQILRKEFPASEYEVMHSVIECAVKPRFEIDINMLAEHKFNLEVEKEMLLQQCGLTSREDLMSNDKFAAALKALGVEPEYKVSPSNPNKTSYAFAKTDQFMVDLDEHWDSRVQALVAARVGHKSTIEETRTQRFINVAMVDASRSPGSYPQGSFPMALRYGAAHTHRLGGDWKLNVQNMPRQTIMPDGTKIPGKLRRSLRAPKGYKVMTIDAAQIEARVNAMISGQWDLIEAFHQKRDIYSEFAGQSIYNMVVDKKANPNERFVGKQSILGLGYQMGGPKFQTTVKVVSRLQLGIVIDIPLPQCQQIVAAYRSRYSNIAGSWKTLQQMLPYLASSDSQYQFGPITFGKQEVTGPNGLKLFYHELRSEVIDGQTKWVFKYANRVKQLYGGKMLENFVQFLSRIIIFEAAKRIKRITGYSFALQVHDELVYVVRDEDVDAMRPVLAAEMCRDPVWMPGLPLSYDLGVGETYGEAK